MCQQRPKQSAKSQSESNPKSAVQQGNKPNTRRCKTLSTPRDTPGASSLLKSKIIQSQQMQPNSTPTNPFKYNPKPLLRKPQGRKVSPLLR